MKIGYPCLNRGLGCTPSRTFRLRSYSSDRELETVKTNLSCLAKMLEYNKKNSLLFLRITSDLVPFASHPVLDVDWAKECKEALSALGDRIRENSFRISMHPDQFNVLNSNRTEVIERSINELSYHVKVLKALGCGKRAKVQIHVGGVYGEKKKAKERFVGTYLALADEIKEHLVIENDDKSYSLRDCMQIYERTGVPVVFDVLHHECLNEGESLEEAVSMAKSTWAEADGSLMIDYSYQKKGSAKGAHAETVNGSAFRSFIKKIKNIDCDIMLEIKDKEESALKCLKILKEERKEIKPGVFQ